MKKNFRGFIAISVIVGIFYLTFQSQSETMALSESFRQWLMDHGILLNGIVLDSSSTRSYAHLPMYFLLGFTLCMWLGWKKSLIIGPVIGMIDETLKIILPVRHFDIFDLCLDFLGIALGVLVVCLIRKLLYPKKTIY